MPTRYAFNLGFDNEHGRAEFERERRRLESEGLPAADEAAERLLALAHALDAGVARCKPALLSTPLAWDDESDALAAWIGRQHHALAALGARRVEAMRRENRTDDLAERVAAAALFHAGEALKWDEGGERLAYHVLHDLLLLSMPNERHRVARACVVDGRRRETTLEALYFRALLLDRFCAGSLPRAQLELLDAWLWEWTPSLRGERDPPASGGLRADLDRNAGLRDTGAHEQPGASLFLALAPLEAARRRVVDDLHMGRMTPAHGCASELRIEEHVALLDHLESAFAGGDDGVPPARAQRELHAGRRVEVWVGLREILAQGMSAGIETGRWRVIDLEDPAIEAQQRARFGEATRRYLWEVDASATGCGFEALETDAAGIALGDVIGWRRGAGAPVSVGCVARRRRCARASQISVGVRVLSHATQLTTLLPEIPGEREEGYQCLFVPGPDASGRGDGFLIAEGRYDTRSAYVVLTAAGSFRVRLNRIRDRGRGWVLAGFEVTPLAVARPVPIPTLETPFPALSLVEDDAAGDAWDRELTSRLAIKL
ncbi:MAG TPA: hypothetical protein VFD95_03025 [Usitatibacter sp.]|jgi:hypothetical protein|nr:hypothetical protein [Usitatibacter sp.]